MTALERLIRVYNLITAAQSLLENWEPMAARTLMQTARLVANKSDEFLELNKTQIDKDCEEALSLIQKKSGEGEKKGE